MSRAKVPDYYAVLRLPRDASGDDINQAYRSLAKKYHPDCLGGDEENFKILAEAYHVLHDPRQRKIYDAALPTHVNGGELNSVHAAFYEQFSAYSIGITVVYIGLTIASFFVLDFSQFLGFIVAIFVYSLFLLGVLGKILRGD